MEKYINLQEKATLLRKLCLEMTTKAGSGHPSSCLSAVDIMTVVFDRHFTYDIHAPDYVWNDRFVLSKGHAAPLFYALYSLSGALSFEELMTLRKLTSRIEGHPTMKFPFTDAATGSLGQGLSVGAGMAYIQKKLSSQNENTPHTYVLIGDGELAEGQNWEAANFTSYYNLDNLIALLDINRLGQSQQTMYGHHISQYERRFKAFGFETVVIDGHNFEEIILALDAAVANKTGKPFAIVAKTFKGKGVSLLENKDNWHGKVLNEADLEVALHEIGKVDKDLHFTLRKPQKYAGELMSDQSFHEELTFPRDKQIATREVYGKVLSEIARSNENIYSLDGDVKNSTYAIDFKNAHPDRYIECFIAEQNMVSVAVGLSRLQKKPFVSTFAAFLTRAEDQIRMAALSHANISFVGSHAGVSIGEDGTSQMGLEDIALFGAIPKSIIFHPSDAVSTASILQLIAKHTGISYLRTLRPKTDIIYDEKDEFSIGGSRTLRVDKKDILSVLAAGITVHEALKAYEKLKEGGIYIRIIDCYSIKPIDNLTIQKAMRETEIPCIITVEDHYEHGGLGDFVRDAMSSEAGWFEKLAVKNFSHSGTMDELLHLACIDTDAIVHKVKDVIASSNKSKK